MVPATSIVLAALPEWLSKTVNYQIVEGNQIWRFGLVLITILITMTAGKIAQFFIANYALRIEKAKGQTLISLVLNCLTKPFLVVIFSIGLSICRIFLVFGEEGINQSIHDLWLKVANAITAIAFAYALYSLVDVIEFYLLKWTSKTKTKLDDMLVPVIRKSLRITIAIVATLWIADGILGADIGTLLATAGVGGIAIALAAKDTIANFFGSITIFADRPFQIDELIEIDGNIGSVEEVGFRSTRIRTLQGHLVTVPNNLITNSVVKNIGRRPFIRRTSNITITYDSGTAKTQKAVEIIKEVLAGTPEINTDPSYPPRVYFSDFNDWALNIYMTYWVKPAEYWVYQQVNENVNFKIMKCFEAEKIEFAFPSQTLYVKKE